MSDASPRPQVVFGVFLGLIWLGEGDSPSGQQISSIAGALFFCVVHNAFNGVFSICNIFPLERNIVLKERTSNTYHVGPYFFAACTVTLFLFGFLDEFSPRTHRL